MVQIDQFKEFHPYVQNRLSREQANLKALTNRNVQAANDAALQRERGQNEDQPRDAMLTAAAAAIVDAFIEKQREAYLGLPVKQKDRNDLSLWERKARMEYNYKKEKDEFE